jgi:hypothetical protein
VDLWLQNIRTSIALVESKEGLSDRDLRALFGTGTQKEGRKATALLKKDIEWALSRLRHDHTNKKLGYRAARGLASHMQVPKTSSSLGSSSGTSRKKPVHSVQMATSGESDGDSSRGGESKTSTTFQALSATKSGLQQQEEMFILNHLVNLINLNTNPDKSRLSDFQQKLNKQGLDICSKCGVIKATGVCHSSCRIVDNGVLSVTAFLELMSLKSQRIKRKLTDTEVKRYLSFVQRQLKWDDSKGRSVWAMVSPKWEKTPFKASAPGVKVIGTATKATSFSDVDFGGAA